ncbi:hypothetical protein LEP1GSC172_2486 [Leptospira noguchii]|uniref:Uncharacterized protein n=1 Tax=Leptospira noguchii TaxID=28182 RepID=M6V496_9LEPT|nr:hypothetical protein LEP1GSC172_2486 [Leptospira noguchii]
MKKNSSFEKKFRLNKKNLKKAKKIKFFSILSSERVITGNLLTKAFFRKKIPIRKKK